MEYLSPVVILVGIIIIAFLIWFFMQNQYGPSIEGMQSKNTQIDQTDQRNQLNEMYQMDQTGQMDSMNPQMMATDYRTPAFSKINSRTVAAAKVSCITQQPKMVQTNEPDGSVQQSGGDYKIPMNDDLNGSFPLAMLPGKVGTFSPTDSCNRFICDGCQPSSCRKVTGEESKKLMTDDEGRNYIADIEKIRQVNHTEFPLYSLT